MFATFRNAMKSTLNRTGFVAMLAVAGTAALPTATFADRDDHRDRHEDRRDDRHDDHGRFDINLHTAPVRRPVIVAQPQQVWVEPVYRTVTENVWVEPTYRTVTDRVWREPVVQHTTQRVLVPDRSDWVNVTHYDAYNRPYVLREWRVVEPAHYVDQPQDVILTPGHWEDVPHQELLCAGHYEPVTHQELLCAGHWETTCAPVAVAPVPPHNDDARIDFRLRF